MTADVASLQTAPVASIVATAPDPAAAPTAAAITSQPTPTAEPPIGTREEVGMRFSPEVALFVGGAVLTVVLLAVFVPFLARVWRQDAAMRAAAGQDRREAGDRR